MKRWIGLMILGVLSCTVNAQTLVRKVRGTDGKPVSSATVICTALKSSQRQLFAITDSAGKFSIQLKPMSSYRVVVRHLSFETDTFFVEALANEVTAPDHIVLKPRHQQMQEVTVVRKAPVTIRQDTVTYRADAYAGPDTRKVEDLLSKMQGFSIGSDGRVSYNGQVVERVMIEGDDLTGRSYQLLTRNLNAAYIDKVEVLLNDHENRVLKEQGAVGKVGINLSIKNKFLGKWNGGIDLLASVNKRYEADGHGILVKKKFKVFSFFNLNNVANNPLDQAEAYEEMEASSSPLSRTNHREMILQSGELFPPDLPEKYIRDNNDAGLAMMLAWKTSKHTSMRLVVGEQKREWTARVESILKTFPDSTQSWQVNNNKWQEQIPRTTFLRWTGNTDKGKKVVNQYGVQLSYLRQRNLYSNLSSIDVSDSLAEQLNNKGVQLSGRWRTTIKVGRSAFSVTEADLWYQAIEQGLSNFSSRYAGYFNLKQGSYLQLQDVSGSGWGFSFRHSYTVKAKSWTMQAGGMIANSREGLRNAASIIDLQTDTAIASSQTLQILSADLLWSVRFERWKKMWASAEIRGGPRILTWNGVRSLSVGGSVQAEWGYKFNQLQSLRLSWQGTRDLPAKLGFTPEPLISGNGVILRSIQFTTPEQRQLFQIGYYANDLKKQLSWSLRLQWRFGEALYIPDVLVTPTYTVDGFQLASGNQSAIVMGSIEKYIHQIRGKLGISFMGNKLQRVIVLNKESSATRNQSILGEVWWAGLIGKSIKLETRMKLMGNTTALEGQNSQTLWFPGWSQKLNWQWSQQGFVSCLWRASPFGSGKYAHAVDAHWQQKIGKRWTLMIQGLNLLNQKQLTMKQISAYQSGRSSYQLVGRYILVGGSLQL
jgi:hypothetical protein